MADIELVIKIPEGAYNLLKTSGVDWLGAEHILNAVVSGIPLPKGHGDLKDADLLDKCLADAQVNLEDELSEAFNDGLIWASEIVNKASTIIEADRE